MLSSFDVALRNRGLGSGSKSREKSRDRRLDPLGLTVLYEPDTEPIADIVFVHGVGGSSRQTWCYDHDPVYFWPLNWLPYEPVISSARISTFGYNAHFASFAEPSNIYNISDFAKELLFRLRFAHDSNETALHIGSAPIIFVAHSMGGLVVKKAFILGQNDVYYRDIVKAVSAFVFLSTPHRGSEFAESLNRLLSACLYGLSPKQYISELKNNSITLQEINEQFRTYAPDLDIISFFETKESSVGPLRIMVLQRDSSTLGYPKEISKPLDADHHGVAKYASREDPNYQSVRDILRYLLEKNSPEKPTPNPSSTTDELAALEKWLNGPGVPFDDQEYFAERRLSGSCEWILNLPQFINFIYDSSPGTKLLWCSGKPGSGKSVMASFLIKALEEKGHACAFYFFRFGDQMKNSITSFYFSIAYQLASLLPEYRHRLGKLFDDGLNVKKSAPRLIWTKLFVSSFFRTDTKMPIFLLVDALDETDSAGTLLKLLEDASNSDLPLRVILTSRRTPVIDLGIDRLSKTIQVDSISIDSIDNTNSDLRMYVEDQMSSMHGDPQFKEEIMGQILDKADGNFLWVHLVVNEVLRCHTEDAVEDALNSVPEDLEPLYDRIDALLAARLKAPDRALSRSLLEWAACSRYPLLLTEIGQAIKPNYPRVLDLEHTIRDVCGEFVNVDQRGHVTMLHSSARDYLCRNKELNFYIPLEQTHQSMFTQCLNALLVTHSKHGRGLPPERSFTNYAATSWPFHLEASCGWSDQESLKLLAKFFQNLSILHWIYLLCSRSHPHTLIHASKVLNRLVKISDRVDADRNPLTHLISEKEFILSWANDLIRVAGKFGAQLVQHPGLIFKLVPAFSPIESNIHRQFTSQTSASCLRITGLSNQNWDDCFAKFAIAGQGLPTSITSLDRYFAILSSNGIVRFYYSSTCQEAREFRHGERVLAMNVSVNDDKLVTYGLIKTKIWDVKTARQIVSLKNPERTKAIAITFAQDDEVILTFSDDKTLRFHPLSAPDLGWQTVEGDLSSQFLDALQYNSPRKAVFSVSGNAIAVAYRGHPLAVWSLEDIQPYLVARCERFIDRSPGRGQLASRAADAQSFCWNPMTEHILGTFNDGRVFRWHPYEQELQVSNFRANNISCSADGRLFVTASGNGTLQIWEFHHFVPVYQLNYPTMVTDLCFDRNECRLYDLRDKFCNIWEPNALVRLLDTDEKASETMSTRESSRQTTVASEFSAENFEIVTAFSMNSEQDMYVIGNDEGLRLVFDRYGQRITELSQGFMTVEHVCWSGSGRFIASIDLSRALTVEELYESKDQLSPTTLFTTTIPETAEQLLLDHSGTYAIVSTHESILAYETRNERRISKITHKKQYWWVIDPTDDAWIIGFGHKDLVVVSVNLSLQTITKKLDLSRIQTSNDPPNDALDRRPSRTYPMNPSDIETRVTKVLPAVDGSFFLVETSEMTFQGRRKRDWMLIDMASIKNEANASIQPMPLSNDLKAELEIPLGFVTPHVKNQGTMTGLGIPQAPPYIHRRYPSFTSPPLQVTKSEYTSSGPRAGLVVPQAEVHEHRRVSSFSSYSSPTTRASLASSAESRSQDQYHCLTFVSKNFWTCTYLFPILTSVSGDRRGSGTVAGRVRKHFFLPRDWVNMDMLDMATVTRDGTLYCPRNGEVAIVSGGLSEEWVE